MFQISVTQNPNYREREGINSTHKYTFPPNPNHSSWLASTNNYWNIFNTCSTYSSSIKRSQFGTHTALYLIGPRSFIVPLFPSVSTSTEIKSYNNARLIVDKKKELNLVESIPVGRKLGWQYPKQMNILQAADSFFQMRECEESPFDLQGCLRRCFLGRSGHLQCCDHQLVPGPLQEPA